MRYGEATHSNKDTADKFVREFKDYVEAEGFIPLQVMRQASFVRKCQREPTSLRGKVTARSPAYEGQTNSTVVWECTAYYHSKILRIFF